MCRVWCRRAEGVPPRAARAAVLRLPISDADGRSQRSDIRRRRRQRAADARRTRLPACRQPGYTPCLKNRTATNNMT